MSDQDPTGDPNTVSNPSVNPTPGPAAGWPVAPDPSAAGYGAPSGYPPAAPPSYPPSGPPPPGYGYGYGAYPGYGYPPQDHPQGTTIFVLGILSLVVCGLLGPVAWIMGNKAMKEIDANPAAYANRGNVQAGRIIGIVATCLLLFGVVVYGLFFLVLALGAAAS